MDDPRHTTTLTSPNASLPSDAIATPASFSVVANAEKAAAFAAAERERLIAIKAAGAATRDRVAVEYAQTCRIGQQINHVLARVFTARADEWSARCAAAVDAQRLVAVAKRGSRIQEKAVKLEAERAGWCGKETWIKDQIEQHKRACASRVAKLPQLDLVAEALAGAEKAEAALQQATIAVKRERACLTRALRACEAAEAAVKAMEEKLAACKQREFDSRMVVADADRVTLGALERQVTGVEAELAELEKHNSELEAECAELEAFTG
ncbi:uncharacterized protein AMSG_00162 [Thecamonas trahens ATCC 50062]|uniref:Uncharacterized protein n=1 Tax=Thecamonas trahens ATCC 50062 TaxID=461836 RepID=A0A0L0D406_THETB|nr:hypothetical protein AMSG_00162 [Thecamonas trahens ATCC 50062]KNC46043.1 hypothetical protein AMSG_00162 [Thecamonas trahens ATCC 50062]|eukprot:XP_013763023.1 hypothetical protein AMSG_00162 [Thecamonas trahens ATCC 50062]